MEFKKPNIENAGVVKKNKEDDANININDVITTEQDLDLKLDTLIQTISCPYIVPKWSHPPAPESQYNFEVLKNGVIVENVSDLQRKAYWVFGRLPNCDIVMAHPTISRYHAVLQFRTENPKLGLNDEFNDNKQNETENMNSIGEGWYLYDLNSTHGTFLNKMRIPLKTYIRVKVGHMIQLGSSTRKYILQGPDYDEEQESELTITEIKEVKIKKQLQLIALEKEKQKKQEEDGISWGMGEDADEETDLTINPYASTNNEELFLDDPKKTLRGYFEREGYELEYKVDEMSIGTFVCRVELPLDDAIGHPLIAEVSHKGKKKDAVLQCALEACRILDRQGVLRRANHEPMRKIIAHSDSDDDDFLDRTGDIERRRQRKAAASNNAALSHQELLEQEQQLLDKISEIESKIGNHHSMMKTQQNILDEDDLDTFMTNLSNEKKMNKTEIRILRIEQQRLKSDHIKLQKLIEIAAPVKLPPLNTHFEYKIEGKGKINLPLFGKRNKLQKKFGVLKPLTKDSTLETYKSDEEEQDEAESTANIEGTSKAANFKTVKNAGNKIDKVLENKKILGPMLKPQMVIEIVPEIPKGIDIKKRNTDDEFNTNNSNKKRRSRFRIRDKNRENVDMDDTEEIADEEKFSQWVPPKNQAGDGFTKLNDKFGY